MDAQKLRASSKPDMTPNSRTTMEFAQKKRREKDSEWHLVAQIKELSKQLDQVKKEKVEESVEDATPKAQLIVVANRLPVTPRRNRETNEWVFDRSSGGLVSAFLGVRNITITWVGWIGVNIPLEERDGVTRRLLKQQPFSCVPVYLEPEMGDLFYNGFCNNVLWPLLHYIPLSMLDSQAQVAELQWNAYQHANKAFADVVLTLNPSEGDIIWIQDYHLMLLPRLLREKLPQIPIGWFLHTPFATSEMYRTLPHREEILRGVLGADLVGFQIYDYARHFHTSCSRVLGTGGADGVTDGNEGIFDHASRRSIAVDAFPIGIEPSRFEACLETSAVKDKIIDLQRRFDGKKVMLGIDRLDYVKGIPHKLKAVEKFLQNHPSWKGKVVLVQIAVPSRTEIPGYQKLKNNVHKLVTRINGEFGSLEDVPIHYLDQSMSFQDLCALYYCADVMFVSSLRDGMNLVSFEFIACQKKQKSGVLVLSEFAGAAQALGAGALLVNPYNTDEVAQALHDAFNMAQKEREERFDYMYNHIKTHTAQAWAEKFVSYLKYAQQDSLGRADYGPFSRLDVATELPLREVVSSYKACENNEGKRLLVFGLLGTLIDYSHFKNLEQLLPSVRRNLTTLANDPKNVVIVCSGRERALMDEWLGDLPIWLVAENGLYYRGPMTGVHKDWQTTKEDVDNDWMDSLKPVFKYFEARTPETFTEVQENTMTWHFSDADDDFADVQAGDLQAHLVKVSGHAPVEVALDIERVEVRPYGVSKGAALATVIDLIVAAERKKEGREVVLEEVMDDNRRIPLVETERSTTPTVNEDQEAPLPFRWILCVSQSMARDDDIYPTLSQLAGVTSDRELDEARPTHDTAPVFNCCVEKTLSAADYHLPSSNEVAGLLDLLAHASLSEQGELKAVSELPSILERLNQLIQLLVGRQLVFLLDYEGCTTAVENPSSILRRFAMLYPTAVVQRRGGSAQGDESDSDSGRPTPTRVATGIAAENLGAISGVRIVSYGTANSRFAKRPLGAGAADGNSDTRTTKRFVLGGYADSYRPALDACRTTLEEKLKVLHLEKVVSVSDDNFSLSVTHKGASDEEASLVRTAVADVLLEFPMLRSIYGRMRVEIRAAVGWNRAKMVEWLTSSVCADVIQQLGVHSALPIYIGEDGAFSHVRSIGGLDVLVTGGPGADSFFLRSVTQVDELLRWFMQQHVAGVTVLGGKLPPPKGQSQQLLIKGQPKSKPGETGKGKPMLLPAQTPSRAAPQLRTKAQSTEGLRTSDERNP